MMTVMMIAGDYGARAHVVVVVVVGVMGVPLVVYSAVPGEAAHTVRERAERR
jgi:hypothetical protein